MSFLYPYPEDAETLPLPKYLHFLYFPLRPFLWALEENKEACVVIGEVKMRIYFIFYKEIILFCRKNSVFLILFGWF